MRRLGAEDAELDGLRQELQHALSLPEQLFGDSHLRLTHEASGVTVEFSALDALRCALRRPPGLRLRGCCCPPSCPPRRSHSSLELRQRARTRRLARVETLGPPHTRCTLSHLLRSIAARVLYCLGLGQRIGQQSFLSCSSAGSRVLHV